MSTTRMPHPLNPAFEGAEAYLADVLHYVIPLILAGAHSYLDRAYFSHLFMASSGIIKACNPPVH